MTAEAPELVMPEKIEDELGHGHFEMMIVDYSEGAGTYKVPAFNSLHGLHAINLDKEFPKQEFSKGKLVAAYRCGRRGMCSVLVNPELLEVTKKTRHFINSWNHSRQMILEESEKDFYRIVHIDCSRKGLEAVQIEGKRKDNGQRVLVSVQFFPSSDEDWKNARD